MAYSDFTLETVRRQFGLSLETGALFPNSTVVTPSEWLVETLQKGGQLALVSEKAR